MEGCIPKSACLRCDGCRFNAEVCLQAASPPPRSPSPPPPAPTPAPAPPPPPPTDPNATALLAKLQLQGANLWWAALLALAMRLQSPCMRVQIQSLTRVLGLEPLAHSEIDS